MNWAEGQRKPHDPIALLAEVPVAARPGGIRPVPTQVKRRRRRHSIGGYDAAEYNAVEDQPVVGLLNPRPDRPHDFGGLRGHGGPPGGCGMGPSGRDGSRPNRNVTGPDRDAPMCACDAVVSDVDTSMANHDATGRSATSAYCDRFGDGRRCHGWLHI